MSLLLRLLIVPFLTSTANAQGTPANDARRDVVFDKIFLTQKPAGQILVGKDKAGAPSLQVLETFRQSMTNEAQKAWALNTDLLAGAEVYNLGLDDSSDLILNEVIAVISDRIPTLGLKLWKLRERKIDSLKTQDNIKNIGGREYLDSLKIASNGVNVDLYINSDGLNMLGPVDLAALKLFILLYRNASHVDIDRLQALTAIVFSKGFLTYPSDAAFEMAMTAFNLNLNGKFDAGAYKDFLNSGMDFKSLECFSVVDIQFDQQTVKVSSLKAGKPSSVFGFAETKDAWTTLSSALTTLVQIKRSNPMQVIVADAMAPIEGMELCVAKNSKANKYPVRALKIFSTTSLKTLASKDMASAVELGDLQSNAHKNLVTPKFKELFEKLKTLPAGDPQERDMIQTLDEINISLFRMAIYGTQADSIQNRAGVLKKLSTANIRQEIFIEFDEKTAPVGSLMNVVVPSGRGR